MISNRSRVLVVKLADIGDAVLALPAIQALRSAAPSATIDVLTTGAGANVFNRSPAVSDVLTLQKQQFDRISGLASPGAILDLITLSRTLRGRRYDIVVLLHHLTTGFGALKFRSLASVAGAPVVAGLDNGRGSFLTHRAIDYGFGERSETAYGLEIVRALGIEYQTSHPAIKIDESARSAAAELLEQHQFGTEYAMMHTEVGEFSPARAWSDQHFATLAQEIQRKHRLPVVLVGVDAHRPGLQSIIEASGAINLCGQTSFDQLCALIEGASLVVGADSSVAHIAAAFNRPLVALFGPSNHRAWKPAGSHVVRIGQAPERKHRQIVLTQDVPCAPCIYRGFSLGRPAGCRSRRCMTELMPADVFRTLNNVIDPRLDGCDASSQPEPNGEN